MSKVDVKKAKLGAKGFSGTIQDREKAFYKANGGGSGTLNDVENKQLAVAGYTGTINDKRAARNKAAGGEKAYWTNLP